MLNYFADFSIFTCFPFIKTGMRIKLFHVVKITCTDLSSLIHRFHSLNHGTIKFMASCRFFVAISMLQSELTTTVSAANVASIVLATVSWKWYVSYEQQIKYRA